MLARTLTLHSRTPTLTATDPRGLTVRSVGYCRSAEGGPAEARINRTARDPAGRAIAQWDPRLFRDASAPANLASMYSLSGKVLSTISVDAGLRISLLGETDQLMHHWDGRGSQRRMEYDTLLRPQAVFEQALDEVFSCTERYLYGTADPVFADRNQCGQLIRHDDPAGTQQYEIFGLTGALLEQIQHFLRMLGSHDWPVPLEERNGEGAMTRSRFNPPGDVLERTDTKGNRQFFSQTVGGQLCESHLQLKGQPTRQLLVSAIQFNAHGQTERETAGNGVITTLEYRPEDGRLIRLRAKRDSKSLQDLRYDYDPVGTVLSIEDKAQPIRYFANQRIDPISRYVYDSLYQLIEATGWEAGGPNKGPHFSGFNDPAPRANYRQTYRYDEGGNLLELTHEGPQQHGRTLTAARHSNRCLPEHNGLPPREEDVAAAFDANGNLLKLQPGQALSWDLRNQLKDVRPVARDSGLNDSEWYVYGADGMRRRKIRSTQSNARTLNAEVRYLPGLEIRSHSGTGEVLHVLVAQAGRSSVRVLHWETEPPKDLANNQYRYSVADHLGSCTLELDSAGEVISQERYHPFGSTAWFAGRGEVEASYKTVRYSGKVRDATGLYYYGFRYYVPWLQRWVNPDPAGDVDGLNFYGFVNNHPINFIDQGGLTRWPWSRSSAQSSEVTNLIEIFNRPNDGQLRVLHDQERALMGRRIEQLAAQSQDLPGLDEYAEGGNGVSDQINYFLRGMETSEADIKNIVATFNSEVETLPDYQGEAYRAMRVAAGVFGHSIKVGSIVADQGYMSASVVPHSVISWLESWADHKPDAQADQQRVLMVFDGQIPKKVAATAFLADHLLIKPLTLLKVKEIHSVESEGRKVTVVGLQLAGDTSSHKLRDLRSGQILLPAINPGLLTRFRNWVSGL
ncbi:RHS repeat domain-containing protein [Pseudomonas fluorescens]|uniref:Toxin n=1 Tax=Pseudomonas fluorescens TaxID=294 RepID=A0A5E7CZJ4_PSEFL|nr:RHS repeat-associated core domain-containing protein [Pseudomonas fluorescens]VVO00742.1 hypothetical protein PS723_02621 [Pseudomonas fluorescens]